MNIFTSFLRHFLTTFGGFLGGDAVVSGELTSASAVGGAISVIAGYGLSLYKAKKEQK